MKVRAWLALLGLALVAFVVLGGTACGEPGENGERESATASQPAARGTGTSGAGCVDDYSSDQAQMDAGLKAGLERLGPAIAAELRANLARIPDDRKIVISADVIGVKGPCDPHDLSSPIVLGLHHIPSATVFGIDESGNVYAVSIRGWPVTREEPDSEGIVALDQVVADPAILERILQFLDE